MKYKFLPKTGLKVSELCLGTMMFGGQTNEEESLKIMDYAFDNGINFFDTANAYNEGECEKIVGKGLKGRRDQIILATKVANPMGTNLNHVGLTRFNIISAVEASLKRLDTDYIDIYYMHLPDYNTDLEESLQAMHSLVVSGKVRYIGVSNFAAWQIADALAICDKRNFVSPVITQNVYNLITRGLETELGPFLDKHQLGMVIYNPLAGGLLTGKHKPGKPAENTRFSMNEGYHDRYWSDENFRVISELEEIASACGLNMIELSMKWCNQQERVTSIITGVSRLSQIEQNIASIEGHALSQDTMEKCEKVWRLLAGTRFQYNR